VSIRDLFLFITQALIWLIIIDAVIANIIAFGGRISSYHPLVRLLRRIVNPLLDPVRRLVPPYKTGGWDLSPIIVILLIVILQRLVIGY